MNMLQTDKMSNQRGIHGIHVLFFDMLWWFECSSLSRDNFTVASIHLW